jgi:regulator of protease activity HflC (stomatin/prohibitin superfamily)
VLTADNIALRFSYVLIYQTIDIDKLLANFSFMDALRRNNEDFLFDKVDKTIRYDVALRSRELIGSISSEELNERRAEFSDFKTAEMVDSARSYGIELTTIYLIDLTFPKSIQDLFAKQLEAKIRAKSDLENARTAVATARALKNASELMKDDPNIRFLQFLETLTKVASKGSHTFVIGDRPDI